MRVYVAFGGGDSDRECLGAFSSEANAREFLDRTGYPTTDSDIEIHDLDDPLTWEEGSVWSVAIGLLNGDIREYPPFTSLRHPTRCQIDTRQTEDNVTYWPRITAHSPISAEDARHEATEQRRAWLEARKTGTPGGHPSTTVA